MSSQALHLDLPSAPDAPKPDGALIVVVYGTPQPAGSKRAFIVNPGKPYQRAVVSDANAKSQPWKDQVAQQAGIAMAGRELLRGPLEIALTFFVRRPKGHIGRRGLLPSAPAYPTVRPDVLKLARGVEDALSGVVYGDDAQIVRELLVKEYGEPERCLIIVRQLRNGAQ